MTHFDDEFFVYAISELSAFSRRKNQFVIALTDGRVVHYKPRNSKVFRKWLLENHVREIQYASEPKGVK